MLGDSISINNFNWNPVILKKNLLTPLETIIFWPNSCKNGVPMGNTQNKTTIVFAEITKPDHRLSKPFYFIKIYVLVELWLFFYFVWCFLSKSVISSHNSCVPSWIFFWTAFLLKGNSSSFKVSPVFFFQKYLPEILFLY